MRILLVTPSYHPNIGGVEYVVKSIAERLAALGHETTVVTGDPKADKPREEEINGIHVVRWPTWVPSGAYHIPQKRNQLRNLFQKLLNDADAVHIHSAHAVLTVWAAQACGSSSRSTTTARDTASCGGSSGSPGGGMWRAQSRRPTRYTP